MFTKISKSKDIIIFMEPFYIHAYLYFLHVKCRVKIQQQNMHRKCQKQPEHRPNAV